MYGYAETVKITPSAPFFDWVHGIDRNNRSGGCDVVNKCNRFIIGFAQEAELSRFVYV